MRSGTLRTVALLIGPLVVVSACTEVEVDPSDRTPPTLTVGLLGAPGTYPDGTTVASTIDTDQTFAVDPATDSQAILLLFSASDGESGISLLSGEVALTFTCNAQVLGGPVTEAKSARFSNRHAGRVAPGETATVEAVTEVSFSLQDLWMRADCETWGQVIDVTSGTITDISATYNGVARNNSQPGTDTSQTTVEGSFTVEEGPVSY